MKKIIVICTGNACRSQMAEGYLRYFGRGRVEVRSAGFRPRQVNPMAIAVMAEDNIDISEAYSKDVALFSGEEFDYLLTVCDYAQRHLPSDLVAGETFHFSIPDPEAPELTAAQRRAVFLDTREVVKRSMLYFLGQILEEQ